MFMESMCYKKKNHTWISNFLHQNVLIPSYELSEMSFSYCYTFLTSNT